MGFWNVIWYNGGKGPGENHNPYWQRYARARGVWLFLMPLLLGLGTGLVSLFAASSYLDHVDWEIFLSYLREPLILALNLLPGLMLLVFFSCLTGRLWAGFFLSALPVLVLSVVNYYKIRLRTEPLLMEDLFLVSEATGVLGGYSLELQGRVLACLVYLAAGTLFAALFLRGKAPRPLARVLGSVLSAGLFCTLLLTVYSSPEVYEAAANHSLTFDLKSDLQLYVSRGFVYPFLYSAQDAIPSPPVGYSDRMAESLLAGYEDQAIPEEKKITIIAVMLEAYTDLSEHPELGVYEEVYAPLHELYEESLHGHLSPSGYGGGTVLTERSFLTGYLMDSTYPLETNSYVWYLRTQGYVTEGYHAGDAWFYDREHINLYLGLERYLFLTDYENVSRYDYSFFEVLRGLYDARDPEKPYFTFSVTYQNHGGYSDTSSPETARLARGSLSESAYHVLNNYLTGVADTTWRLRAFIDSFREDPTPVVVIFFGDHMPGLGEGASILTEAGIPVDLSTEEGMNAVFNTPWLMWANDAAKAVTGSDFAGDMGRISPAYLMNVLFAQWGEPGSAWQQFSARYLDRMPVANTNYGLFLIDGELTPGWQLKRDRTEIYVQRLGAEYYDRHHFRYGEELTR